MHVEHHPLITDFPELREQLHSLRQEDHHFARLADEYEALDKRVCRVEEGIEMLDENALSTLKVERVALKDELARQLRKAAEPEGCCGKCSC
ncbi:MAG: YdcH family protein [Pseudomonadaceae bacterium]|jgi:uncharacterized protein YdcH (DUF465 family)|nr:YdcH family protein [Pseudomonadaceae bacterium]